MERVRKSTMKKRGVVMFAHNNSKRNYYRMALAAAKRVKHFLNLPVTLITGPVTLYKAPELDVFDEIIIDDPDYSNKRDGAEWINKNRFNVWRLTPYYETLLLDVDYVVNSDKLLKLFDIFDDYMFHDSTSFIMDPNAPQEYLSTKSFQSLWATVLIFKKNKNSRHLFQCMEMIQDNFNHYADIHGFIGGMYRNDYSLTLASRIVNGHILPRKNIIPWNLLHVGKNTKISHYKNDEDDILDKNTNTKFMVEYDNWQRRKIKKEYIFIKDTDFHMLNKDNFDGLFVV